MQYLFEKLWILKSYFILKFIYKVKKIGENVTVRGGFTVFLPKLNTIEIGNNVSLNDSFINAVNSKVIIDDYVFFGNKCMVLASGHDYNKFNLQRKKTVISKPVHIGIGAWIGSNATILPGVTIGQHSVVGAGAVVTKNVRPYTIVGGVPAIEIKKIEKK